MSWTCKQCGLVNQDDVRATCVGCFASKHGRVVLTGISGVLSCGVTTQIGNRNAKVLVGDDARFFASHQFDLVHQEDTWWLRAFNSDANLPNLTLLNGAPCGDASSQLKEGDIISIASRSDPSRTAAALTVALS